MEKNDLAMIKAENDRLVTDIEKLKQRLREEITRTQAGVRLDLNLEKGRMREESSGQELKIKEVDTRIEQEIAGLRTAIQASKVRRLSRIWWVHIDHDTQATTLQYIVGFGMTSGPVLGIPLLTGMLFSYRLLSAAHGISALPSMIGHLITPVFPRSAVSPIAYI